MPNGVLVRRSSKCTHMRLLCINKKEVKTVSSLRRADEFCVCNYSSIPLMILWWQPHAIFLLSHRSPEHGRMWRVVTIKKVIFTITRARLVCPCRLKWIFQKKKPVWNFAALLYRHMLHIIKDSQASRRTARVLAFLDVHPLTIAASDIFIDLFSHRLLHFRSIFNELEKFMAAIYKMWSIEIWKLIIRLILKPSQSELISDDF